MFKFLFRCKLALLSLILIGCAQQSADTFPQIEASLIDCPEKRPQVCTMIYKPVCALDAKGSLKTFASDCSACADASISGYTEGECSE